MLGECSRNPTITHEILNVAHRLKVDNKDTTVLVVHKSSVLPRAGAIRLHAASSPERHVEHRKKKARLGM